MGRSQAVEDSGLFQVRMVEFLHSVSNGRRNDPVRLLYQAAERGADHPLQLTPTVQLVDDDGMQMGYLSGSALENALKQVYEAVLGQIHSERCRKFDAIADWELTPAFLAKISDALVDPLVQSLCGEYARVVWLCYHCLQRTSIRLPRSLWWSLALGRRMKAAGLKIRGFGQVAATVAHCLEYWVGCQLALKHLPLAPDHPVRTPESLSHHTKRTIDCLFASCLPPGSTMPTRSAPLPTAPG